jgi:hypothetical protein
VKECTYAFNVPNVQAFVALASVLEGVGVSAYVGAAGMIASKAYLTAAGEILTSESRHSAYLRSALGKRPAPQPFASPLDYDQVHSMAVAFFVSCPPDNPSFLPVKAFPSLTWSVGGPMGVRTGYGITLTTGKDNGMPFVISGGPVYAAFIGSQGAIHVPATSTDGINYSVVVPSGVVSLFPPPFFPPFHFPVALRVMDMEISANFLGIVVGSELCGFDGV